MPLTNCWSRAPKTTRSPPPLTCRRPDCIILQPPAYNFSIILYSRVFVEGTRTATIAPPPYHQSHHTHLSRLEKSAVFLHVVVRLFSLMDDDSNGTILLCYYILYLGTCPTTLIICRHLYET